MNIQWTKNLQHPHQKIYFTQLNFNNKNLSIFINVEVTKNIFPNKLFRIIFLKKKKIKKHQAFEENEREKKKKT